MNEQKEIPYDELVHELHYQLDHNICECGNRLKPNHKFCHQCGRKLGERILSPGMELYKRCSEKKLDKELRRK